MKQYKKNIIFVLVLGAILIFSSYLILAFTEEVILHILLLIIGILIFNSGFLWYIYFHYRLHEKIIGILRNNFNKPTNIQQIRRCPNCGRPLAMEYQLCPYCGRDFRMNKY